MPGAMQSLPLQQASAPFELQNQSSPTSELHDQSRPTGELHHQSRPMGELPSPLQQAFYQNGQWYQYQPVPVPVQNVQPQPTSLPWQQPQQLHGHAMERAGSHDSPAVSRREYALRGSINWGEDRIVSSSLAGERHATREDRTTRPIDGEDSLSRNILMKRCDLRMFACYRTKSCMKMVLDIGSK